MQDIKLLYIRSDEIVSFVGRNPIKWMDGDKEKAKIGGVGDKAGRTPTPAIQEFIALLLFRGDLFTQEEYADYCLGKWKGWIAGKPTDQQVGVKAKLYRNFYPSMIDSLHVWAMMCESGMFDSCMISSREDAIGKTDLIVRSKDCSVRIALIGPTPEAQDDRKYKVAHRGNVLSSDCVEVVMPKEYPKYPGNKRWFKPTDIMAALLRHGISKREDEEHERTPSHRTS